MPEDWNDVDRFVVDTATDDLERRGEVQPLLVAFRGDRDCFLAFLRWFPKGAYADPMIELLSLAMALDADRLAFAITGRLTSLEDPVPPVTDEGDLRQRALVVEYVDGAGGPPSQHSVIHPFDQPGDQVVWDDPVRLTGGQGWIHDALGAAVANRAQILRLASDDHIRDQALRCVGLGHDLYLSQEICRRLGLPDAARR